MDIIEAIQSGIQRTDELVHAMYQKEGKPCQHSCPICRTGIYEPKPEPKPKRSFFKRLRAHK